MVSPTSQEVEWGEDYLEDVRSNVALGGYTPSPTLQTVPATNPDYLVLPRLYAWRCYQYYMFYRHLAANSRRQNNPSRSEGRLFCRWAVRPITRASAEHPLVLYRCPVQQDMPT